MGKIIAVVVAVAGVLTFGWWLWCSADGPQEWERLSKLREYERRAPLNMAPMPGGPSRAAAQR